jgi:glutamate-1-semialdehyde 2,1-aminomutase
MGGLFFTDQRVIDQETAQTCDTDRYAAYFHAMLDEGIYLPPSQFEAYFFSALHGEDELDQTLTAQRRALERVHS